MSRHSFEVRSAHALRNNLGSGWLTLSKDARYDEAIDVELERLKSEGVEARSSDPADNTLSFPAAPAADLMSYEGADYYVEWFLRDVNPKADRIGLISQLLAPEEVKNRLRERYLPLRTRARTQPPPDFAGVLPFSPGPCPVLSGNFAGRV